MVGSGPEDVSGVELLRRIASESVVVVDFHASWCGPCHVFAPLFAEVASELPDASFLKVDVDAEPLAASELQVRSIPTLMVFRDGRMVHRSSGVMSAADLRTLVASALAG